MGERSTFAELRHRGRRRRSGPITVVHLPASDTPAGVQLGRRSSSSSQVRLAFALGRKVGNAVQRNRLRRRLQHVFVELVSQGQVPPGAYLVTAGPDAVGCSFEELRRFVQRAVAHIAQEPGT